MTVLIVGGSRGIGAALVRTLNAQGIGGVFTYCSGGERAERILKQCRLWKSTYLNLSKLTPDMVSRTLTFIGREITTIIVCAAAGLNPSADRDFANKVNALGPASLISHIDEYNEMKFGVLYLTSPAAHSFTADDNTKSDFYSLVAETKNAGETLLHLLGALWSKCRTVSTVVCELVKPSTAYTMFQRFEPYTVQRLESSGEIVDHDELIEWLARHVKAIEHGIRLDPVLEY